MELFGKSKNDKKLELFNKGLSLIKLEKYVESLTYFNEVIKIDPNHVDSFMSLLLISTKLEMYPEVIDQISIFEEGIVGKNFFVLSLSKAATTAISSPTTSNDKFWPKFTLTE